MHATIAGETSAFGWLSKVMAWQLDLVSHLPPDECVRRLRAKTGRWKGAWTVYLGGWKVFSDDPIVTDSEVIGHVGETSLRICRRVPNENAFQIWLFGKLKNENGGTRLRCRFGLNP